MTIRKFTPEDQDALFRMMEEEGSDWREYYGPEGRDRYLAALLGGASYVLWEDGILCGYIRCREDEGFGVYVYDLLVAKPFRGRHLGKALMEQVLLDYPGQAVYVMSDADPYYRKLGYKKIGSIFQVIETVENK